MQIRQLFDQSSGTYTYLLFDSNSLEGVLIDSVYEQHERDLALLRELDVRLSTCLETHCHADHVTGAWLMKEATGCNIAVSAASGMQSPDIALGEGDQIRFGKESLSVTSTPGHTNGCISFVAGDNSCVFTGDAMLIRGCGRTDFQEGSASTLFHSIRHKLFLLPDDCIVYPGHDYSGRTSSTIGEEKQYNPRIGGQANESDFVGYMENMHLPHPRKLDVAVPANLKLGKPEPGNQPEPNDWAPVITTYSGIHKIAPSWVAQHLDELTVVDVRTISEHQEEQVAIPGALHIPIGEFRARISELPADRPVMAVCRSGRRSALACQVMKDAGIKRCANIDGGMMQWLAEGLPVKAGH